MTVCGILGEVVDLYIDDSPRLKPQNLFESLLVQMSELRCLPG